MQPLPRPSAGSTCPVVTSPADTRAASGAASILARLSHALEVPERRHLSRRVRNATLVAHVLATSSWLGAVVANLFFGISAVITDRDDLTDAYYTVMDPLVNTVMPAAAIASVVTGLLLALATRWGLLRHWWILIKLGLALATVVVGVAVIDPAVQDTIAARAASQDTSASGLLLPGVAATPFMLASATILSVTKPWGRTPWTRK